MSMVNFVILEAQQRITITTSSSASFSLQSRGVKSVDQHGAEAYFTGAGREGVRRMVNSAGIFAGGESWEESILMYGCHG